MRNAPSWQNWVKMRTQELDKFVTTQATLSRQDEPIPQPGPNPLDGIDLYIPDPTNSPFKPLIQDLAGLAQQMRDGQALKLVTTARQQIAAEWLTQADKFPPSSDQHQVFETVSKQFQTYADAWQRYASHDWADAAETTDVDERWAKKWQNILQHLKWPAKHTIPASVIDVQQRLDQIASASQLKQAKSHERMSQLESELACAEAAIDDGHPKQAVQHLKAG